MPSGPILQFGEFQFDMDTPLLTRGGRSVELSPRALQVLRVLVRNAGQVVLKDDLLHLVWPAAVVEEGNLAVHISALRRALRAGATNAEYIETIPKRGYRFAPRVDQAVPSQAAVSPGWGVDRCRTAAYYLQQQTARGCARAANEFREWLRCDPGNARAKAGLGNALLFRWVLGDLSRAEAAPRAQSLLDAAHRIDPTCIDAQLGRSRLFCLAHWDWEKAQEELQRALPCAADAESRSLVEAWQGSFLVERGEVENGLQRLQAAHAVCPLSPFIARFLADAHFLARDFSGCVAVCRKALPLHPHSWHLYRTLGKAFTALEEYGHARRSYRRATLLYDAPQSGLLVDLAYLGVVSREPDRGAPLLGRLERLAQQDRVPLGSIAPIYAALGDRNAALHRLERACANRDWSLSAMKQDYRLDPLRTSSRFRQVLTRVGI